MASSKRAIKLFAVVALAGACDQGAAPKQPAKQTEPKAQPEAQDPLQREAQPAAAAVRTPRTLPNGRPACSNVGAKGEMLPHGCDETKLTGRALQRRGQ